MRPPALLLTLLVSLPLSLAVAQKGGKGKGQSLSLQGKALPDVSAVTETGDPFPLRKELKGKHGVIVFGCLT